MLALIIFVATVALVVWQPRGLNAAWGAAIGAAVALLTGVVHLRDLPVVWHATWNATLTLVGLIVLSLVLDSAGFFRWLALVVARWGAGGGTRLFTLLIVFAAVVSALFANDGGILILTPLALELAGVLKLNRAATLAFALAVGFVVDATSLPLTISNLVNIILADAQGISFARYAAVMVPTNLVAVAACLGVLLLFYRRALPRRYDLAALPTPESAIKSRGLFLTGWIVTPVLLAGYFLAGPLGVPLSAITGAGAIAALIVAGRSRHVSTRRIMREAPWSVVLFSLAMYLVVYGLRDAGWTAPYGHLLAWADGHGLLAGVFTSGLGVAALSAVMNNLPATLFALLGLQGSGLGAHAQQAMTFATVVGADIGPKLTPIGSLATLLWLHVLAGRGLSVSWGEYFRAGLKLTPPVLLVTLLALVAVLTLGG